MTAKHGQVHPASTAATPALVAEARRLLRAVRRIRGVHDSLDGISTGRYLAIDESNKPSSGDGRGAGPASEIRSVEATMKKQVNLGKQLRQAVRRSGLTRNQIARQTDVSYSIIHRFMAGTGDIQLATASKIATVIGLEFSAIAPRKVR